MQAELDRLAKERAEEKERAEAAQLDTRIRTLKALRLQAKQDGDEVASERYADELDDAKRDRDRREILSRLQAVQKPQAPSFDDTMRQRILAEEQEWRVKNAVYDPREYAALVATNEALRLNPEHAQKPYREVWDAALAQVRGIAKAAPPARPRAAYAPVEGTGARPAAKPVKKTTWNAKEQQIISGLMRYGKLTAQDFEE